MNHNFGEKPFETGEKGEKLKVWQTPKYEISKKKAIEMIDSNKYGLEDGDFWILKNRIRSDPPQMAYTGLIVSHNACLKINDALDKEQRFKAECVSKETDSYNHSLIYTYQSESQGLYEVGEVSASNCKNPYPHAMAFKRMFDRVVLKLSKLAFSGVYSETEADEFREPLADKAPQGKATEIVSPTAEDVQNLAKEMSQNLDANVKKITARQGQRIAALLKEKNVLSGEVFERYHISNASEMSYEQAEECIRDLENTPTQR